MSMGLFAKLRLGGLAAAHAVANKLIDMNSVGAVEQQIRDIESAIRKVEDEANGSQAELRGLHRTINEKEARAKVLDAAITVILTDDDPTNDHAATGKQVELNAINEALPDLKVELADAEQTASDVEQVVDTLNTQHTTMMAQLDKLRRLTHKADAKETATHAMAAAREQLTQGSSVDGVLGRLQARADKADVAFDREKGKMAEVTGKNEALTTAAAQIEARKKSLAASKSGTTVGTQPSV